MRLHRAQALALAAAIALIATSLAAPGGALARTSRDCPARAHTLVKAPNGRVWHAGSSLYACSTAYGVRPRSFRLGPWARGARVAFDGVWAAWTTPHRIASGDIVDRGWAASALTGRRWLSGTPLVPASGPGAPRREARAAWITVTDEGAAWITRTSDVVLALHHPDDTPSPIGTLPAPLLPAGNQLLVGSWPAVPAAQLAASAKLEELPGDGDECGGANDYRLTVQPDGVTGSVGAIWNGSWSRPNCG